MTYSPLRLTLRRNTISGPSDFRQASKPHFGLHFANAFLGTRKTCWIVSFDKNLKFVGREAQLDRLALLFSKYQPSKTALVGLGGVGKTQVILEFVHRTRESDPDCSIFWLPATNVESLQHAYLEAGEQLGISGINEEQIDVKKLMQDRLSQESAGR